MAIINDVRNLAAYIQKKYFEDKQMMISPIKMQKSLYFLFAYWGGFVRKSNRYPDVEDNMGKYDERLFDEPIEAWVYGPVIPVVYREFDNIESYYSENIFSGLDQVKDFVDGLLKDLFNVSDFTLVEISHEDKAWKMNFSKDNLRHNTEIYKEEIIQEYANK